MERSKFDNQTRFNFGYWNAVNDVEKNRPKKYIGGHIDNSYYQGYLVGWVDAVQGNVTDSSQKAWTDCLTWGDVTE